MKLRITTIVSLLLAISVALAHGTSATVERNSTPSRINGPEFAIRLPAGFPALKESVSNQTTDVGVIELHMFSSGNLRGACIISYSDFPPQSFHGRSAEKILEDGRDGALKSINGTLDQQEHTTIQGYPAIIVYSTATAEGRPVFIRYHFVLVQQRAYQFGFLTYDKGSLDGLEVEAYFKSFRLEQGAPAPH
jgi:hypothetical protein